jgi:predicted glutamine amidotransferase
MCELLALSANTPTDLRFSFHGLRLRGGSTGDHADGWGLASYDIDGLGVRIYREDAAAAFSQIAAAVADLDLRAHCSMAHIRKATKGVVALENCHPFHRHWQGREWVFAHNGDLHTPLPLTGQHQPIGDTDSEAAFCWMLEQLEARQIATDDEAGLFAALLAHFVVVIYLGIHILVSKFSRNLDPMSTMALAMFSYFAKFMLLGAFLWALTKYTSRSTIDRTSFGVSAIALTFAWLGGEIASYLKLKTHLPLPHDPRTN